MSSNISRVPTGVAGPLNKAVLVAAFFAALQLNPPPRAFCEEGCSLNPGGSFITVGNRIFYRIDGNRLAEVDSSTTLCMSCHDGTVASSLVIRRRVNEDAYLTDKIHPVDVPYPVDSPDFVPIVSLDEALELEGGRVTCTTCHRADGTGLSVPVQGSRLCLSCHIK